MARWGMVIDLNRCNGCQACEIACRSENNIAVGGSQAARENRTISWMRVLVALGGSGGVIAVGRDDGIAMPFNSEGMLRGAMDSTGRLVTALLRD